MAAHVGPTREEARRFYESFSLAVGLRDWLAPNPRHEQLKLLVADLVGSRRGLEIADVGCGVGVMTAHLRRYGTVTGLDFSREAIAAARRLVPGVTFVAGALDSLPSDRRFDLITLFDVLEHIPEAERPRFLAGLRERLADDGAVFISTPFPAYTRFRRAAGDDTLQIIDEEVRLPELLGEAAAAGLQLIAFRAFDVFRGSPEYQVMLLAPSREPGGAAVLRSQHLDRRLRLLASRPGRLTRRVRQAAHLARHREFAGARWMLTGDAPDVRS